MENFGQKGSHAGDMADHSKEAVEKRLNELISILSKTRLDEHAVSQLQEKLNIANELLTRDASHTAFPNLKLKSPKARRYTFARKLSRVLKLLVSLLLILLGFGMIIMPAPEYFEMFTLFYLNPNDGVTIMDVISLIVAFTGVSLLITGLIRFNNDPLK
ncbi:hypothetical protein [Daejeonella sp. JGW-45]|uniref:hypothetical protein n=1 Tax=Daejeonella sp. JGW-45 TaxID=3034148 RepID=UPI0023EAC1B8|nr:hypothetical protein [Daejeonella sp. JGW-45]